MAQRRTGTAGVENQPDDDPAQSEPAAEFEGRDADLKEGDPVPSYAKGGSHFTHIDGHTYTAEDDIVTGIQD